MWAWLVGILLLLARLAGGLFGLRRVRLGAAPCPDVINMVDECRLRLGLKRRPLVFQSATTAVPLAWGAFRPLIVLPDHFTEIPSDAQRLILLHELAHIQANHAVLRVLSEVLCAILWFQPLAWFVRRELREEQERECDDRVVEGTGQASSYARLLLSWHDPLSGEAPTSALAFVRRAGLKERVAAVLDARTSRRVASVRFTACAWLTALATALPLAAFQLRADEPGRKAVIESSSGTGAVRRLKPPRSAQPLMDAGAGSPQARTKAALDRILAALRGRDWKMTGEIEAALSEIRDLGALDSVEAKLQEPDSRVRERVAWVLGEIGDPGATASLVSALGDVEPHVRHNVAWALGKLAQPAAIAPLKQRFASEAMPDVRGGIVWALGAIGGPEVAELLTAAQRDPSPDVRDAASYGLARQK